MTVYDNCHDAIRHANGFNRPVGLAYRQGEGWFVYEIKDGTADKPEFLCLGQGKFPIPISEAGRVILRQMMSPL